MPAPCCETFDTPCACQVGKMEVDDLGARVAAKLGYQPGAPLEPIVEGLGGRIEYHVWEPSDRSGSLEVFPGETPGFVIRLPTFTGNLRNRFTIAHELGHYFLHADVGRKAIRVDRAGTGRVEWEANWFASGFLLPAGPFREDWAREGGSVWRLSELYQVSEAVIEIRRETLGLE